MIRSSKDAERRLQLEATSACSSIGRPVGPPVTVFPFGGDGSPGWAEIVHPSSDAELGRLLKGALCDGMRQHGWKVVETDASRTEQLSCGNCDLLILGTHIESGLIDPATLSFLRTARSLLGKPLVVVITGVTAAENAMHQLRAEISKAGARLIEIVHIELDDLALNVVSRNSLESMMLATADRLVFVRRPIAARTY